MAVPMSPVRTNAAKEVMNHVALVDRVSSNSLQSAQSGVLTLPISARYWRSHSFSYSLSTSSWSCIKSNDNGSSNTEMATSAKPLIESESKSLSVPDSFCNHELHNSL